MPGRSTARAAPFKLCASRYTLSIAAAARDGGAGFSSSRSNAAMACKCSLASTLNVARSFLLNSSSGVGIRPSSQALLHLVLFDLLAELLSQFLEVVGRGLELLGAGDVLRAGLLNALDDRGDLVHADQLLLAGRSDLGGGLRCF